MLVHLKLEIRLLAIIERGIARHNALPGHHSKWQRGTILCISVPNKLIRLLMRCQLIILGTWLKIGLLNLLSIESAVGVFLLISRDQEI